MPAKSAQSQVRVWMHASIYRYSSKVARSGPHLGVRENPNLFKGLPGVREDLLGLVIFARLVCHFCFLQGSLRLGQELLGKAVLVHTPELSAHKGNRVRRELSQFETG